VEDLAFAPPAAALPAEDDLVPASGVAVSAAARARLRGVFQQNYAFIWRILRRLGVAPDVVSDAAQQVFLVTVRKIDQIAEGSERSFLLGTAMRTAAEARRMRAILREVPSEALDDEAHPSPTPEELCESKRRLAVLDAILEELPVDLRAVFVLFELEGLSTDEIVLLLSLPRGTVASRLRRAREEFQAISKRLRARSAFERRACAAPPDLGHTMRERGKP
jgi:RNA polymerase sigma-70 factor (ECF subfamily)